MANLISNEPLPGGTDSINIPKVLTGTTTAIQTADNTTISDTDLTDTYVTAPVCTIAGQQSVAIQLLDQSPISFDQVIFADLVASYAAQVDSQVLMGSGTSGQVLGMHNTSGISTVTPSAVTYAGIYSAVADAVQLVHTQRFLPPTHIVMHPRRWAFFLAALDTSNRPLVVPSANGIMNAMGREDFVESQMVVGQMHGLPVVTDPNITTSAGSGTNQDYIYVLRATDPLLFESGIRSRVLPEVNGKNLSTVLQVYSYVAFTAGRYPQSIVEIGGLTPPSF